jgi:hypothetical protein
MPITTRQRERPRRRPGRFSRKESLPRAYSRSSRAGRQQRRPGVFSKFGGGGRAGSPVQPKAVAGALGAGVAGVALLRRRRASRAPSPAEADAPVEDGR